MFHFTQAVQAHSGSTTSAVSLERALRTADNFKMAAQDAQNQGLKPDIIVAHSGWGAGTYARAVWPEAAFIVYAEWWYRYPSPDTAPEEPDLLPAADLRAQALARNAPMLMDLAEADAVICPTAFQAAQFPLWLQDRITVLHDGVDTKVHAPNPDARKRLELYGLPADAELITYVARGMEPYRGFPAFMRAVEHLQATRPMLHALIVGSDRVAYGRPLPEGQSWGQRMLAELNLDPKRTHFTGPLPREDYVTVLQASDAHCYLTIPFVLSWSFVEAMSIGCPIVASDVDPVREFADGTAVRLIDHSDTESLVFAISSLLDDPDARRKAQRSRRYVKTQLSAKELWPKLAEFLSQFDCGGPSSNDYLALNRRSPKSTDPR